MSFSIQYEGMNASPAVVRISSTEPLATVTSQNYFLNAYQNGALRVTNGDLMEIAYAQGTTNAATNLFSVTINTSGIVVGLSSEDMNVPVIKVFTLTSSQLASAGKVNIQVAESTTSQYFIQDVKVLKSTGLSGNSGDRLLAITDGTLVFNNAGITAAVLGTPIFTIWGGTGNPISAGTSDISTAGANLYFQYSGGTTDYGTGSVQVAVTWTKVTA